MGESGPRDDTVIYLDHAASPPPPPAVAAAIRRALRECWGSPSGVHTVAGKAAECCETARVSVARLVNAAPEEVVFTSGATETRNLMVAGALRRLADGADGVVATALEHPTVMMLLAAAGTVRCEVADDGRVEPGAVQARVDASTGLVCIHHGQDELGTVQDVPALVRAARAGRGDVTVVVDAVETTGLLPIDVAAWDADAVALGGPALDAPPWTGALWIRPGARLRPLMVGGAQEFGRRPGPENVPGIAALGACADAAGDTTARARRRRELAGRLWEGLRGIPGVALTGPAIDDRIPGHVHVTVAGVEGESLTVALAGAGVAAAPGSTCTQDAGKASAALEAIGLREPLTHSGVLFTCGWSTTPGDIDTAIPVIADTIARLRRMSPIR